MPQQQAIWLDDLPVALISVAGGNATRLKYVQPDHLGTPRVVIDPVRNVAIWEWSSKGEVFGDQAPANDPDGDGIPFELALRFPGQQATDASGMFYNYQREYDPVVGRYSQTDPIGLDGGLSVYGYVGGNPVSFVDPSGLQRARVPLGSYSRNSGEFGYGGYPFYEDYGVGGGGNSEALNSMAFMLQVTNLPDWMNPYGTNQLVLRALLNKAFEESSAERAVPSPERRRSGYSCICRANRDGRSERNCSIDDKEFAMGYGFSKVLSEAKKLAERDAKQKLGARSTHHIQCRCVNPKGEPVIPHG